MKRLREYFLSGYIEEKDILERSRHIITFNISYLAASLTLVIFLISLLSGSYIVALRALITVLIIVGIWFYCKKKKTTMPLARLLIISSGFMLFSNLFFVFQRLEFSAMCLFLATIVFSFIILNRGEAIIYVSVFTLFILVFTFFKVANYQWTSFPPQELHLVEQIAATLVGLVLMGYVLWQYDITFLAFVDYTEVQKMELREAKESAEEMNKLKSNFLANMSHEIRTPINGIMGISEIIYSEVQNPEIKEMAKMQKESSQRLLNTISSILQLSKLESESMTFQLKQVDVSTLISNSVKLLAPIAWKKNIALINDTHLEGIICMASEEILFQVFNNIIGNAIKFTEIGGVELTSETKSGMVHFHVKDTGIGISKEFIPRVFNTFEQESQGISRSYEGSGLGLSITKKYIELIGGNIKIKSKKGEGSTFTIVFPYKKSLALNNKHKNDKVH